MSFTFLPHTADVKVRAEGHSFTDACNHALKALRQYVTQRPVGKSVEHSVSISARSKEALLFDLLSEAIYLLDAKDFLVHDSSLRLTQTQTGWSLQGVLRGDSASAEPGEHVKAVTYHDMRIVETPGHVVLEFVLDV